MIRAGEATGDSAEYEQVLRGLAVPGAPAGALVGALCHILKRLGPPEDEGSIAADGERFERDDNLT